MRRLLAALLVALPSAGCAPLTFANDGAIDFERYRSVLVSEIGGANGAYATEYLAAELRHASGFRVVTTDPRYDVDLRLDVSIAIDEYVSFDTDGDIDVEYRGMASFTARDAEGTVVDTGIVTETSHSFGEALEAVLDELAHHYLLPYRA